MRVRLVVSRELLEQMLCLGGRRIVGVDFEETDFPIEPTAQLTFEVDAPDAPEGTTDMEPIYLRMSDGTVTMSTPGWIAR